MIKGTTKTGFGFEVDETAVNDMEIIDAFVEIADGDPTPYNRVIKKLFDKEQVKALYDHVRDENGRVPIDKIATEINDVFSAMGDAGKN